MLSKDFSLFRRKLMGWYKKSARSLPWRETSDPYKIWISEIMLQQTTVNAVIPYYERWVKKYPSIQSIVRAKEESLLNDWQGLGYYSRVRNIKKAAHMLVDEHGSQIPRDPQSLRKVPGFGPYTVGAVLSIAYDLREPIVDANVRRVFMRVLGIQGLADVSQDKDIYALLNRLMPRKNNHIFNQALMELGALVCTSRNPKCNQCPLKAMCQGYKKGIQEIIPQTKKKVITKLDVVIGVIRNNNKYLIQKRIEKGLLQGMWEFPGGKIEQGESPTIALKREIKEEVAAEIESFEKFMRTVHYYTNFKVNLNVYRCKLKNIPPATDSRKWITLKQFEKYPLPSGSAKIVEKLNQQKNG